MSSTPLLRYSKRVGAKLHQGTIELRLLTIGVPKYLIPGFAQEICKWEYESGVEWTIKRLKDLKVDLIRRKSGLEPLSWIKRNRHGDIRGYLGSLFRWSDQSDRNFARAIQALMAYTLVVLPSLTEAQKRKFLDALSSEEEPLTFINEFAGTVSRFIRRRRVLGKVHPLVSYRGSPSKKAPSLDGGKSVVQAQKILEECKFFETDWGTYLTAKYPQLYADQLIGLERHDGIKVMLELNDLDSHCDVQTSPDSPGNVKGGEIHFLQEPGGKLRSIASPYRIHQEALRPLGEAIYSLVSELPWDCTFDQSKAVPFIQDHLRKGGQVHSVDLSSATDYFPLSLQVTALRLIFGNDPGISLFEEISRSQWKSSLGTIRWKKGQPLGLYPSFASFTLTHGLLLLHLAGGYDHQFFVVGDDVVILDDDLADKYKSCLDEMKCPWSPSKTLSSNSVAEFGGKVITQGEVIPQLKWRNISENNFLDICRLLGRPSRRLLNRRQKRVFDQVAYLCDPIGLNFSKPGDNLAKMVQRTLDFYDPDKVVLGSLMGLRRLIEFHLSESESEFPDADASESLIATFDEKVKSAMVQTVFGRWYLAHTIDPEAFESLPEALGLEPRLPAKDVAPSEVSTLVRYERLLLVKRGS